MKFLRGKVYYVWLAIAGVLALIAQIPGLFLVAAMLIIPGLVLFAAMNLFVYMLALLPVRWALRDTQRRVWLAPLALLPALAIAFLPKEYADRAYAQREAVYTTGDFADPASLTPRTVAIVEPGRGSGCDTLCEKLLYGGYASAVTRDTSRYRIEKRDRCPEIEGGNRRLLIHAAEGNCLIRELASIGTHAADVVIQVSDLRSQRSYWNSNQANRFGLYKVKRAVRYDIHEAGVLVEQRIQVTGATAIAPFLMGMDSNEGSLNGWPAVWRSERRNHAESIEVMLQRRYGWPLADATPAKGGSYGTNAAPIDMDVFAAIVARSAPGVPLNEADAYAVSSGIGQIVAKPVLDTADIDLLRLAIGLQGPRMNSSLPDDANEWRPELAVLVSDAVARIERPHDVNDWIPRNMFGFLSAAPRDLVSPYAARIEAVLGDARGTTSEQLLQVWHEISPNAVKTLARWAVTADEHPRRGALVGLCRAAQPGREDVAQALRAYLQITFKHNATHFDAWPAIAGLIHTSGIEEARRVTDYDDARKREAIQRPFRIALEKPWPRNCGVNA